MRLPLLALTIAGMCCNLIAGESTLEPLSLSRPLTIEDAVRIALLQNASILQQIQQLKVQRGLFFQAQSQLLPQLTMSSNYMQNSNSLTPSVSSSRPNFDLLTVPSGKQLTVNSAGVTGTNNAIAVPVSTLTGGSSTTSTTQNQSWSVQITVSQLVYDGGATIAGRRQALINEQEAYYTLRDTIDSVVSTVRTQFYQILLNKALVQVQEESVNLLQSQLEDQKSRYEAGTVPQFNVLQAEGQLQNQIPQLIAARNNYLIAQQTLARTLAIPAGPQYTTNQPLPVEGELGFNPIQYDLGSALIAARANRPFLKAQQSAILANVENITVQAAGFKPKITANAGWEQINNPLTSDMSNTLQGWFINLQGSWSIFDGLLTYGKLKEARAQLEQAKLTYDDSVRQVELEVATACDNLHQAALTVDSAQTGVAVNLEALRLADERLAAGTGTQLDVLNAQTQLTTARSNLVSAEFSYLSAFVSYQQNTGTETKYNNIFDDPANRPMTLTRSEAAQAARARYNSPLDPGMPATKKGRIITLQPPKGEVVRPND
ncbi:MAG TPA: TolC family protein [Chthoniobacterales bacterium]|jgi:outer membrane protein TolC|nr:TolC family protein [Chthoniobacterales bacterium]